MYEGWLRDTREILQGMGLAKCGIALADYFVNDYSPQEAAQAVQQRAQDRSPRPPRLTGEQCWGFDR